MELIGSTKKRILLEIAKGPTHGYQLALSLTLPLSTVYGHLKDLQEMGLICNYKKERQIIYELTKKGKSIADIIK